VKPQRTVADDLKWAVAVLVGFVLGALVFGADWSIVLGAAVGVIVVTLVKAMIRRSRRA
jgi:uncharacterized transporter YbjL